MKSKHLSLAIAALLVVGALWLARSAWRSHAFQQSSTEFGFKTPRGTNFDPDSAAFQASKPSPAPDPNNRTNPGRMLNPSARLAPPVPNRRFTDFTPEQRVQFARQGHGPGG